MQYQALRKVASSRLMLFTTITKLLTVLFTMTYVWYDIASNVASKHYWHGDDTSYSVLRYVMHLDVLWKILPLCCFTALPVIALFMIYHSARSDQPLKRTGFSILRGYMIVQLVLSALAFAFAWYYIVFIPGAILEVFVTLLISIVSVSVLKTTIKVVTDGYRYRRFTYCLPILLIVSLAVKAGNLIVLIVSNLAQNRLSALSPEAVEFRFDLTFINIVEIGMIAAGLVSSLLLILLCFRGRKALMQPSGKTSALSEQ